MQKIQFLFDYSPWFILLGLLLGLIYAAVLYKKEGPWGPKWEKLLFTLRFVAVSAITFLLLGPYLKQIQNKIESPSFVILLDNSSSLSQLYDSAFLTQTIEEISAIGQDLEEKDFEVVYQTLTSNQNIKELRNVDFRYPASNLDKSIKNIQNDFEGRNLAGVLLVSDGIYNQGISPAFRNYNFPIYTLALGDTIPKKDINLQTLYYNKVAYEGNRFSLRAEVSNNGFEKQQVIVSVKKDGKVITSKKHQFDQQTDVSMVDFLLDAKEEGMQHFVVEVSPLEGEFSEVNNQKDAFIDIIEGKEKILFVAKAPHPDIKAIRSAIETKSNYEFYLFIPGISNLEDEKYDLMIFHGVFDLKNP
ncbi:VWA domain-containing protein, partial [Cytophagales bacterium RKSG123]|nr:VWA domain-containing protein [Xanthovirga aplysinae]